MANLRCFRSISTLSSYPVQLSTQIFLERVIYFQLPSWQDAMKNLVIESHEFTKE